MYLITPDPADLDHGLKFWHWIGLDDKTPVAVTAFGDVFFVSLTGIWFLDTVEGIITRICGSRDELAAILESDEGKNHYLLAGLVQKANREGMSLAPGECYTFKTPPILGGPITYENIQKRSLVEAQQVTGQTHEKARKNRPAST